MNALENRVPPPLVLLIVAALMVVGGGFGHVSATGAVLGGLVVLAGAGIVMAGFATFRRAGTTIDPVNIERAGKLVDSGVFGWSRNPMYLGFTLALIGWSVVLGSPGTLLGPLAYALFIQRFQIAPEERIMAAKFGADYDAYRRRVRRWL